MSDVRVIFESTPKARKEYDCMACEYFSFFYSLSDFDLTFSELKLIVKARKNKYKIKKGETYIRQSNVYEGQRYTFTAIPEIHQLCIDHEIYN